MCRASRRSLMQRHAITTQATPFNRCRMGRKTSIDISDKAMPFIQFLVDPVWKPMFRTFAELELSFVFVENTTWREKNIEEHRSTSGLLYSEQFHVVFASDYSSDHHFVHLSRQWTSVVEHRRWLRSVCPNVRMHLLGDTTISDRLVCIPKLHSNDTRMKETGLSRNLPRVASSIASSYWLRLM